MAERPSPMNAGLRGPTYCDGPDAWVPGCGWCATCGGEIAVNPRTGGGRSRYFCANRACGRWWRQNHQWDVARATALQRDRRCVELVEYDAGSPRGRPCGSDVRAQVDHMTSLADTTFERGFDRATKYRTGCHNHLSNLQVLCGAHHAEKTEADARVRQAKGAT